MKWQKDKKYPRETRVEKEKEDTDSLSESP